MCDILFGKSFPDKSKRGNKNSSCGIQIKAIPNYKAETSKSSNEADKTLKTDVFLNFSRLSGDKDLLDLLSLPSI